MPKSLWLFVVLVSGDNVVGILVPGWGYGIATTCSHLNTTSTKKYIIIMRRQSLNASLCINTATNDNKSWLCDPNVVGRNWTYYWAQYSSTCSNQEPFIQQSLWAPGGTTIKTRISSKGKISSLAMAEKVWLIFSSTHNCMVLTNIKQFSKNENKQTSQWYNSCQEALLQHRNDLIQTNCITLLCQVKKKRRKKKGFVIQEKSRRAQ